MTLVNKVQDLQFAGIYYKRTSLGFLRSVNELLLLLQGVRLSF
jgi:hypothetical protein